MQCQDNRLIQHLNKVGQDKMDSFYKYDEWSTFFHLAILYCIAELPIMLYILLKLLCHFGLNSVLTQFLHIRVSWFQNALLVGAEFMGKLASIITMSIFAALLLSIYLKGIRSSGTKIRGSRVWGKRENYRTAT